MSGKEARLVQIVRRVAAACAHEAEREGEGTDAGDPGDIEEERNAAEGRVQPVVELEHVDEEDGGEGEGARGLELWRHA